MSTRTVGIEFSRPTRLPLARLRWKRGDEPPQVYVSTRRVRFWLAFHESQVELQIVLWPRGRQRGMGEAGPHVRRPAGLHRLTETFSEYDYDGAEPGSGEWYEDD